MVWQSLAGAGMQAEMRAWEQEAFCIFGWLAKRSGARLAKMLKKPEATRPELSVQPGGKP